MPPFVQGFCRAVRPRLKNKIAAGLPRGWNAGVNGRELATDVLRGVSRSFYLSLRWLPARVRGTVSVAYLLARVSDTLADTAEAPLAGRLDLLRRFARTVREGTADSAGRPTWRRGSPRHSRIRRSEFC